MPFPSSTSRIAGKPMMFHSVEALAAVARIERVSSCSRPVDRHWARHDWSAPRRTRSRRSSPAARTAPDSGPERAAPPRGPRREGRLGAGARCGAPLLARRARRAVPRRGGRRSRRRAARDAARRHAEARGRRPARVARRSRAATCGARRRRRCSATSCCAAASSAGPTPPTSPRRSSRSASAPRLVAGREQQHQGHLRRGPAPRRDDPARARGAIGP